MVSPASSAVAAIANPGLFDGITKDGLNAGSNDPFVDAISGQTNNQKHPDAGQRLQNEPSIFHDSANDSPSPKIPVNAENSADVLDSSPLKPARVPPSQFHLSRNLPSTSYKKKSVAFSDDLLVSDIPSSPPQGSVPKKSILKPRPESAINSPSPRQDKLKSDPFSPHSVEFWHSGSIVQVAPLSMKVAQLVDGCMHVLQREAFDRKFEVYATLNNICKTNPAPTVIKLLANRPDQKRGGINSPRTKQLPSISYVETIGKIAKRDILDIEGSLFETSYQNDDPFSTRAANQALKLVNFILTTPELNILLPVDLTQFFYAHAAAMIAKPDISKSLILPYILILKECRFSAHRKRMVFDSDFPDIILQGLLKMKNFKSSSLVVERLIASRNLMINFPHTFAMPGNLNLWMEKLLLTICDTSSPIYSKYLSIAVMTMLEAARSFLGYKNVVPSIRKLLDSKLPSLAVTFASNALSFDEDTYMIDHVVGSLNRILDLGEIQLAMDLWSSLILLTGNNDRCYEKSTYWTKLARVHEICVDYGDSRVKQIAVTAWNAVIFSLCQECYKPVKGNKSPTKERYDPTENALKVQILLRPFFLRSQLDDDSFSALNNIFLGLVYTLGNSAEQLPVKFVQNVWKHIIHQTVHIYYKGPISRRQQGLELLKRLLNPGQAGVARPLNEMRCLSTEPTTLVEIRPLSRQAIHCSTQLILGTLSAMADVAPSDSLELYACMLEAIKPIIRKEVRISSATIAQLSALPAFTTRLLGQKPQYLFVTKLIRVLILNFDCKQLKVIESGLESVDLFQHITLICEKALSEEDLHALRDYITQLAGPEALTPLEKEDDSKQILQQKILDLQQLSDLLKSRNDNSEELVQMVIDQLNSVTEESFETALAAADVNAWTLKAFEQFIGLAKHFSSEHLKRVVPTILRKKLADDSTFLEFALTLLQERYASEVVTVCDEILARSAILNGFLLFDFKQKVKGFLAKVSEKEDVQLIEKMLVACLKHKYDIKAYVKNRWEQMPQLKALWLEDHDELFYETVENPVKPEPVKPSLASSNHSYRSPMGQIRINTRAQSAGRNALKADQTAPETVSPIYTSLSEISPQQTPTRVNNKRELEENLTEQKKKIKVLPLPAESIEMAAKMLPEPAKNIERLKTTLVSISQADIDTLDSSSRFQLESSLIGLMYRLRQPSS